VPTSRPVHPHACGENSSTGASGFPLGGSPPRMWGKLLPCHQREPRLHGSPPRMWGKSHKLNANHSGLRFTPTHVGKIRRGGTGRNMLLVHPHACGENVLWAVLRGPGDGSPPRMWGKCRAPTLVASCVTVHPHACGENVVTDDGFGFPVRFTPTHVGKIRRAYA